MVTLRKPAESGRIEPVSRWFLVRAGEFFGQLLITLALMLIAVLCEDHFLHHRHHEAWLGLGGVVECLGFAAMFGTVFGVWGRGQALWGSYWR